ncbi:MAG: hypothetical protein Q9160_000794 [Pyrenula sp. 1 TL-2023]
MVDNETPTATSDSGAGDDTNQAQSASKLPAPKDRECDYCHQPFTSSSLGRHLDQYVSKKKPDGIHDVEEIKRARANITRRQPKGTQATKPGYNDEEAVVAKDSPAPLHCSPSAEYLNGVCETGEIMSINTPIWQSTGVINGLPDPRIGTPGGTVQAINTPMTLKPNIPSLLNKEPPPEKETSRALELALREVLDSIKSASVRTAPKPSPFDFNFEEETFPSLCMRLLPPPASIFSLRPFPTAKSLSIEPPDKNQYDPLRASALSIITRWKADHLSNLNTMSQSARHTSSDAADIESTARQRTEIAINSIEIAHLNWTKLNSTQRNYDWLLALLQAFARERSEREQTAERLKCLQEEANQLQTQVETLSKCQWPREFALCPPSRGVVGSSIGTDGVRELYNNFPKQANTAGAGVPSLWDYDDLVDKWRRVIRQESARPNGTPIQPPLPAQIQTRSFSPINSGSHHHNIHTPNSHYRHPPPPHHHHYQPRPSPVSTPPETPGSTGRPSDLPPAKRPRLEPASVTNGIRSEEISRPSYSAGSGARPDSRDRPPSLPMGTIDSGPAEAPFLGKRTIREVKF